MKLFFLFIFCLINLQAFTNNYQGFINGVKESISHEESSLNNNFTFSKTLGFHIFNFTDINFEKKIETLIQQNLDFVKKSKISYVFGESNKVQNKTMKLAIVVLDSEDFLLEVRNAHVSSNNEWWKYIIMSKDIVQLLANSDQFHYYFHHEIGHLIFDATLYEKHNEHMRLDEFFADAYAYALSNFKDKKLMGPDHKRVHDYNTCGGKGVLRDFTRVISLKEWLSNTNKNRFHPLSGYEYSCVMMSHLVSLIEKNKIKVNAANLLKKLYATYKNKKLEEPVFSSPYNFFQKTFGLNLALGRFQYSEKKINFKINNIQDDSIRISITTKNFDQKNLYHKIIEVKTPKNKVIYDLASLYDNEINRNFDDHGIILYKPYSSDGLYNKCNINSYIYLRVSTFSAEDNTVVIYNWNKVATTIDFDCLFHNHMSSFSFERF